MADRLPSIYGEPVWTEVDALRTREFFSSPTGVRLARIIVLSGPILSINSGVSSDKLVGYADGYRKCSEVLNELRIIPGTLGSDGELLAGARTPTSLPDLDLPAGHPAWGGTADPSLELVDLPIAPPEK